MWRQGSPTQKFFDPPERCSSQDSLLTQSLPILWIRQGVSMLALITLVVRPLFTPHVHSSCVDEAFLCQRYLRQCTSDNSSPAVGRLQSLSPSYFTLPGSAVSEFNVPSCGHWKPSSTYSVLGECSASTLKKELSTFSIAFSSSRLAHVQSPQSRPERRGN